MQTYLCRPTFQRQAGQHLSEVDAQAKAMFFQLVKRLEKREGITEQLKAEDQMEWVRQMNSARNRAEEVIYNELIYA